ncbi:MAG: alpha/beta hydrolase [Firmicutes bacterium]|nr:alpha/beta hydrolase [Bacillota bacterium]
MEEKYFVNKTGDEIYYLEWDAKDPKCALVISHGMAEHPERYDDMANYLTANGVTVYAIFQMGHGCHAKIPGHMEKGDYDKCVSNLSELVEIAKKDTGKDVFLLGHSMGSFIAQIFIERYHNIKGLILSGSSAATPIMKMAKPIASLVCAFSKDKSAPSQFMNNMSFGSYNKAIENVKTPFDWLSRDEAEVQKYVDDPLCGYVCSKSFFREMAGGFSIMAKPTELAKIDKDLPILIHGGSKDPVSDLGKGLYALAKQYKDLGLKDVTLTIYPDCRHEIHNELNKQEVYENTLKFMEAHL